MAGYRVSYKVLRQQGEDMKAVAKMLDGYADKVAQISSKLGDDSLLAEIRGNLQKLRTQLGESRAVLNTSGELLIKTVENYDVAEKRQVKKVDSMRAHNRDFYKRPVVVASVGGAAAGGATSAVRTAAPVATPAATPVAAPTTTVNYTDNSININNFVPNPSVTPTPSGTNLSAPDVPNANAAQASSYTNPGVIAGVGALSGAAAAGSVIGGSHLKKTREKPHAQDEDDLDTRLESAIQRVHDLEKEDVDG